MMAASQKNRLCSTGAKRMKKSMIAGAALITLAGSAHAQSSVALYGLINSFQ
jgi:hypothetical protein